MRFQCDNCSRMKKPGEIWILGFAAESLGVTAARREISIVSAWDEDQAVQPLAVHFCCDECRAGYMAKLFGNTPEAELGGAIQTRKAERRHIRRVIPGAVVETVVREKPKARSKRKKAA